MPKFLSVLTKLHENSAKILLNQPTDVCDMQDFYWIAATILILECHRLKFGLDFRANQIGAEITRIDVSYKTMDVDQNTGYS